MSSWTLWVEELPIYFELRSPFGALNCEPFGGSVETVSLLWEAFDAVLNIQFAGLRWGDVTFLGEGSLRCVLCCLSFCVIN